MVSGPSRLHVSMLDITNALQGEARCELFEAKHESHLSNDDGQLSYDPFPYGTDYASRFHIKTMQVCAIRAAIHNTYLLLCALYSVYSIPARLSALACVIFAASDATEGTETGMTGVTLCRFTGIIASASYRPSIKDGVTVPCSLSNIQMLSNGLWTCVAFETWPFLCIQCK